MEDYKRRRRPLVGKVMGTARSPRALGQALARLGCGILSRVSGIHREVRTVRRNGAEECGEDRPKCPLRVFEIYFGAVRIVCFGSSTILWASPGTVIRNGVSGPSASTSPRKTNALPAVAAYTGTAVTRSSGASFCTI